MVLQQQQQDNSGGGGADGGSGGDGFPDDFTDDRDEFRDLNYWSVPPPLILDDPEEEAKAK